MIRNAFFALGMAFALLFASGASQTADATTRVTGDCLQQRNNLVGSGEMITKQIAKPDFDEIKASRSVKVILTTEASDVIKIKADDNVMPYVVITCKDRTLRITIDSIINALREITVEVTVPVGCTIDELSASSAAIIASSDTLNVGEIELAASSAGRIILAGVKASDVEMGTSSAGRITAKIAAREVDMEASSAGRIEVDVTAESVEASALSSGVIDLTGTAQSTSYEASSAGRVNASKLNARTNKSQVSSGAKIKAHATDSFQLAASSGGVIETFGEGRPSVKTSSGGVIRQNQ